MANEPSETIKNCLIVIKNIFAVNSWPRKYVAV